jgi:biopolymer transport protein ExbD
VIEAQQSRRAQRMQRRAKRSRRPGSLNLVSLMDIFTILVFFLLVQSSAVEVLPNTDALVLPESVAEQRARETVLVMVTNEDILVNGRAVMKTAEALDSDQAELAPLREALAATAARITPDAEALEANDRGEITVMADKGLPFALIRRIMQSSVAANYGKVSFAVLSREQSNVQLGS